MRKIINSTYVSLDGDQQTLDQWHFDYWSDELAAYAERLLGSSDALLMGRGTYEGFEPAWTSRAGQDAFADRMNEIPKYVVSSTLKDPTWNNTTVIDPAKAVAALTTLKSQPGENILMYGFGPVAKLVLENELLDELRLWVHPVLAGGGTLVTDGFKARFELTASEPLDTGVVVLTYRPAQSSQSSGPS
jgi:dihydrofolate reductase